MKAWAPCGYIKKKDIGKWSLFFFFFKFIYLFIYFWLCWVFVSVRGLSLVAASGGHSSSQCAGLSLSRPLLLRSTGSRRAGSAVVAHGPSSSAARGIFPDQGSNPCLLHWQADSQPLHHQGSQITFLDTETSQCSALVVIAMEEGERRKPVGKCRGAKTFSSSMCMYRRAFEMT